MKGFNALRASLAAAAGKSPVHPGPVLQERHRLDPPEAKKLAATLGAGPDAVAALMADPFTYRLMEIVGLYGDPLRSRASAMLGAGIMSATDFMIDVEKVTGREGEARIRITMNGKWLPYKQV